MLAGMRPTFHYSSVLLTLRHLQNLIWKVVPILTVASYIVRTSRYVPSFLKPKLQPTVATIRVH